MAQSSFQEFQNEFLQSEVDPEREPFPTRIDFVPDGEYKGQIVNISPRKFPDSNTGEWRALVEFTWSVLDPELKQSMGLDDPRVRQTIFLDTKKGWNGDGNPPLDMGPNKNVALGRLLTGLNLNDGRKFSWNSFMHEEAWIRVVKPRNEEQSVFADVAEVSHTRDGFRARKAAKAT